MTISIETIMALREDIRQLRISALTAYSCASTAFEQAQSAMKAAKETIDRCDMLIGAIEHAKMYGKTE